jgi:UDPglucose 6-dehydrogenase
MVCGADVREVARAIGSDSRMGPKLLQAGPRFSGRCFQENILDLVCIGRRDGFEEVARSWEQVVALNEWQQHRIARLVVKSLFGTVTGKRIAVLGFAFKADTNDTRESPVIRICQDLLEEGARLAILDPKVGEEQIRRDLGPVSGEGHWEKVATVAEAADNADAIVITTEWAEFRSLDWNALARKMRRPSWLFDARGVADAAAARAAGLKVWRVGEGTAGA